MSDELLLIDHEPAYLPPTRHGLAGCSKRRSARPQPMKAPEA